MSEYISKKEAIEAFSDMSDGVPITHGDMISDTTAVNVIKSISPADVRPNIHGHWKVGFGNTWCSCSECSGNGSTNWSYCPWCGADMRKEGEQK